MERFRQFRDGCLRLFLHNKITLEFTDEMAVSTLRFKETRIENLWISLFTRTIAGPNRRMTFAAAIVVFLYFMWSFLSRDHDTEFWVSNSWRFLSVFLLLCYIASGKYRVFPWKSEVKATYFALLLCFTGTTMYHYFWDLIMLGSVDLSVPVSERPVAILDEAQVLAVFAATAYILATISNTILAAFLFWIANTVVYLMANWNRVQVPVVPPLSLGAVILTALILAYRKELYYRLIFTMKRKIDPGFKEIDEAMAIFKEFVMVDNKKSAQELAAFRAKSLEFDTQDTGTVSIPRTMFRKKNDESSDDDELPVWHRIYLVLKHDFLMIHQDPAVGSEFSRFVLKQAIGQTRLALWILSINSVLVVLIEISDRQLTVIDVVLRAGVVPVLLLIYDTIRLTVSTKVPRNRVALRVLAFVIVLSVLGIYLAGAAARLQNPGVWGVENAYITGIVNLAMVSILAFGFRFSQYFLLTICYFIASVSMQIVFGFGDHGFIIGANAAFVVNCIFMHQYERILFAYFALVQKVTDVEGKKPREADIHSKPEGNNLPRDFSNVSATLQQEGPHMTLSLTSATIEGSPRHSEDGI